MECAVSSVDALVAATKGAGIQRIAVHGSLTNVPSIRLSPGLSRGRIELRGVTTTGCVRILARDKVRAGHVDVNGLDIIAADARSETERPHGYGVYVITGAFEIEFTGGIKTNGAGVAPIEQHGAIESLRVSGGLVAAGGGFDRI
ncbi:hypothetical protein [Bosea sp. TAF32]|uniref:hypothetical protein n=1 Tax=Bosea sp. TAF32 TaxID=3237482 RepID=UPI003F8E1CE1